MNEVLEDMGVQLYYNDDTVAQLEYVVGINTVSSVESSRTPLSQPSKSRVSVIVRPRRVFDDERPSQQLAIRPNGVQYTVDEENKLTNGPVDHFFTFDNGVFPLDTNPSVV